MRGRQHRDRLVVNRFGRWRFSSDVGKRAHKSIPNAKSLQINVNGKQSNR
jgi:hypothetical protein